MRLTSLFIILAISANAQNSTLSINAYSLNTSTQKIYRADSLSYIQYKDNNILFTMGYSHKLKNEFVANIQFGMLSSPYKSKQRSNVDDDNSYFLDSVDNKFKAVYFRLGFGRKLSHKNYFFLTSINIPISYTFMNENYYRSNYYLNDSSFYNSQITTNKYPKLMETGLLFSQSMGYKITKSFSLCVEVNTGFSFTFQNGTRYYHKTETFVNGTQTIKEQAIRHKNSTSSSIVFYPVISLNYHF